MTIEFPDSPRKPIWFQFSGHKDGRNEIEASVNSHAGKNLLSGFKAALLENGWSECAGQYDSDVFAEDWGWCVFMQHGGALMMLGTHVLTPDLAEDDGYNEYLSEEWIECGLSVEHIHKRTLGDRLRGRNKADPEIHEKAFRSVWDMLSSQRYIRGPSNTHPDDR